MVNIIFKVIGAVAIALAIITIILVVSATNKNKTMATCQGKIIKFYENSAEARVGDYENASISPVVTYEINGQTYEFIGNYYSTSMKIGDEVEVLYNKDDVSKATIKKGLFLGPIITGALSVGFILAYGLYLIIKTKGLI